MRVEGTLAEKGRFVDERFLISRWRCFEVGGEGGFGQKLA
jgi:hypothetical protein